MSRSRVRLIHWNPGADELARLLRSAGFDVDSGPVTPEALRALNREPPEALVVDLTRLPSQGRDVAVILRRQKGTRGVPLVFLGGAAEKVEPVRNLLPDAWFGTWSGAARTVRKALQSPRAARPVVPPPMGGYSGAPLAKKLGIRAGSRVLLVDAPPGFEDLVGDLPQGARLVRRSAAPPQLTLLFVRSARGLETGLARVIPAAAEGLWIIWPKKGSALASDVSERDVRAAGLAAGLVDFKVCAVDETWSGLRFARARAGSDGGHGPRDRGPRATKGA